MACCPDKTYSTTNNYEFTPKNYVVTLPFNSALLTRDHAVSVYVSQPSVIQVTFSGTITGVTTDPTIDADVGFQLSMYNILGGITTSSYVNNYPRGTIYESGSIAVSTTYAWTVCAGTYVINVTVKQPRGLYGVLKAGGDLCIVTTRK